MPFKVAERKKEKRSIFTKILGPLQIVFTSQGWESVSQRPYFCVSASSVFEFAGGFIATFGKKASETNEQDITFEFRILCCLYEL